MDIFTHPIDYQPTNHSWLVDLWLPKEKYHVTKVSEMLKNREDILEYLPNRPYSNIGKSNMAKVSIELKEIFKQFDYIIAFECKEETREIINKIHKGIVFIYFSPLRFCDKQTFTINSNNQGLQNKIDVVSEKGSGYYSKQAIYVEKLVESNCLDLNLPKNSVLLVGQVEEDLSVWNKEKFLNLDDFLNEIFKIVPENAQIYYKSHPLSKINNQKIISDKRVIEINENIYRLLAAKSITKVITVSSSVAKEAIFFGKEVVQFFNSFIEERSKNIPYTLNEKFWEYLFSEKDTIKDLEIDSLDIRPIRKTYWGYSFIKKLQASQNDELKELKESQEKIIADYVALKKSYDQLINKYDKLSNQKKRFSFKKNEK